MKIVFSIIGAILVLAIIAMAIFVFVVQNVETPEYQVVIQDGVFEIRDYPSLVVAEVVRDGERKTALRAGFSPLANYIFAKERTGERVAMTAPVTQQRNALAMTVPVMQTQENQPQADQNSPAQKQWTVRFIMPANYQRDTLPVPANNEVQLREIPARRVAVVRFSGRATDDLIIEQERALRAWIQTREFQSITAPIYAYYNDPLTPGFLRRNEVMLDVTPIAPSNQ